MDIEPVFTKDTKLVDSKSKQYKNIILWSVYGIFLLVVLIVVFVFAMISPEGMFGIRS